MSLSNDAAEADAQELLSLAQLCRISHDIKDQWQSISSIGFDQSRVWHQVMGAGVFSGSGYASDRGDRDSQYAEPRLFAEPV